VVVADVPPKETVLAGVKFVPVTVTFVPPVAGPVVGDTPETEGRFENEVVSRSPSTWSEPAAAQNASVPQATPASETVDELAASLVSESLFAI
jgi:hypothetical protein